VRAGKVEVRFTLGRALFLVIRSSRSRGTVAAVAPVRFVGLNITPTKTDGARHSAPPPPILQTATENSSRPVAQFATPPEGRWDVE